MGGSTTTTDDSRSDTSDRRAPRNLRTDATIPIRSAQHDRNRSLGTRSSGSRGEAQQQPVLTKEYIKWRSNADKFVARAQKEMFDLMEESFSRQFPSRQGPMELQPNITSQGGPGLPDPQTQEEKGDNPKRRRKPNNPESYPGAQ